MQQIGRDGCHDLSASFETLLEHIEEAVMQNQHCEARQLEKHEGCDRGRATTPCLHSGPAEQKLGAALRHAVL